MSEQKRYTRRELLAAAAGAAVSPLAVAEEKRPNIVFLFSDDHHYQCLGAAGNPHIRTPNLDRLAERGVLFTNGLASTPQCCPSRGILLSGLETYQNGLRSNGARSFREGLGPTVVEQLRRSGYDTALIGKSHVEPRPQQCGFARAPLWFPGGSMRYQMPRLRRGLEGKDEEVEGHITDLLAGAAAEYARSARQPFFLWAAFNAPHTPWYAGAKYRQPYEGKSERELAPPRHPTSSRQFDWVTYYSVITHLDEAVGRLVTDLEKAGLWKNTVIFFLGDNGYMCGTKGWTGKVVPWEESIRVPYFVAGGEVSSGVTADAPAASIDLPATWLEMAGVEPAYRLAGRSLRPLLTTGKGNAEAAFAVWDDGRPEALAVRTVVEPYRLVRTRRHKYIVWESGRQALYDWQSDAGEDRNLIDEAKLAAVARELKERLRARMEETGDRARRWLG
jgi:arylsulfatase A-like enzyme